MERDSLIWLIIGSITAKIGYEIHGSIFWAIVDFFFWFLTWFKWILLEEVNFNIIKDAFAFLN